jgi:hypothetical protein
MSWPPDWPSQPSQYLPPNDATQSPPAPGWSKADVFAAGEALALWLLSRPGDAENWRGIVVDAKLNGGEHIAQYRAIITKLYPDASASAFNSNDFANVYRVAWLLIGRALTSLMNTNPHGDWADPPPNGSIRPEAERSPEVIFFYHTVPNATGYYAVSTADMNMPDAGV